ncbi:MAG: OB-fold nucleic acid binding domain-containing protein [Saprospiraceae bacterium]
MELVWFQSLHWLEKSLQVGKEYIVFGRLSEFNGRFNITHPEMEEVAKAAGEDGVVGPGKTFDQCIPVPTSLARKDWIPRIAQTHADAAGWPGTK